MFVYSLTRYTIDFSDLATVHLILEVYLASFREELASLLLPALLAAYVPKMHNITAPQSGPNLPAITNPRNLQGRKKKKPNVFSHKLMCYCSYMINYLIPY